VGIWTNTTRLGRRRYGDAHEEPGDIGGEHGTVPHLSQIDQGVGEAQLVRDPEAEENQRRRQDAERAGRRPAPPAAFAQDDRETDDDQAEDACAEGVQRAGSDTGTAW
jgi:hypothetical protein